MPEFSTILQTPEVRAIVQEKALERAFHDALFAALLFRSEAVVQPWPAGVGDEYIATAPGLMPPSMRPLRPGVDPTPVTYALEQWVAQLQTYASTSDVHMPTSIQAIVDLFMQNAHMLGLQAAQSLNRKVRNKMYNAAEAGHTVVDGAQPAVTTLRVRRLNGFTRARSSSGSKVRFDPVSSSNPLSVTIAESGVATTRSVIGFTADIAGDEYGPGVLLLSAAVTVVDRDYVVAIDASDWTLVGGGNKVDDIGITDRPRLQDVRDQLAKFHQNNVPIHPDGHYHCHLDPTSNALIFSDPEFQRLNQGLPEGLMYQQFVIGRLLGCLFFNNSEDPVKQTVYPNDGVTYSDDDDFAGELTNNGLTTGVPLHRMLFTAMGGLMEYRQDQMGMISEAGIIGKTGEAQVVNNGVEINADGVVLIFRAPLNRLQDKVSVSWRFVGDWVCRTDAATGGTSRYKRFGEIVHGQP